ncbi:hypothetical protein BKA70DRAFT_1395512 [Coprinopsis sp. MPI-PUGE-AT-0042]|nr:hypothetical protein BKA70DRAFT_1395512 [Coprinopsis sp. MPI-PUGE-AT-0042]
MIGARGNDRETLLPASNHFATTSYALYICSQGRTWNTKLLRDIRFTPTDFFHHGFKTYLKATIKALGATNVLPPANDVPLLMNQLGRAEAEIKELRLRLTSLEAWRADMLQEQRILQIAFKSPIRKLPSELIAEILKACFPNPLSRNDLFSFLALRSVCSMWRETAFSTPELWNRLEITLERDTFKPRWDVAGVILRWFDRAADLPLTFKVAHVRDKHIPWQLTPLTKKDLKMLEAIYLSVDTGLSWSFLVKAPKSCFQCWMH